MRSSRMNSNIMFHCKSFSASRIIAKVLNLAMSFHVTFQIVFCGTFGATDLTMQIRDDFLVVILVILPFAVVVEMFAAETTIATFVVPVKKIFGLRTPVVANEK